MDQGTRVGYDFAHAIVDDHSRLAYVELHSDERAQTVTDFVARALEWFETQGITAKRLMSDNAWSYTRNRSLRELLTAREDQAPTHLCLRLVLPSGRAVRLPAPAGLTQAKGVPDW